MTLELLFPNFDRFEKSPIIGVESDDAFGHQPNGLDAVEEKTVADVVAVTSKDDRLGDNELGGQS